MIRAARYYMSAEQANQQASNVALWSTLGEAVCKLSTADLQAQKPKDVRLQPESECPLLGLGTTSGSTDAAVCEGWLALLAGIEKSPECILYSKSKR